MEWTKVKNKKGNILLIGDLESWLKKCKDEGNYKETGDDVAIQCPHCLTAYRSDSSYSGPYEKLKLYVLDEGQVGYCHRCNQTFVNNNDSVRYKTSAPEPPVSMRDFELVKLRGKIWDVDLFESFDEFDQKGFDYLVRKRHHYFKQLYKLLKIRFNGGNPVIPFFFKGDLIYYQIKQVFGNSKLPYFSPPISHKPAYIIERTDNKKFVICEGTFDAIACLILFPDRTPVAILGSSITDYQITMLRTYVPEDILVFMDETELSIKVADKLSRYINYADINIRPSNGMDPEEVLKLNISRETE